MARLIDVHRCARFSRAAACTASLLVLGASVSAAQEHVAVNTCVTCHAASPDPRIAAPAQSFSGPDVHRDSGFACVNCHGGNPDAAEAARAHDAARGFRGAPRGPEQIAVCARCHADPELMRRYAPKQRVDQAAEYATSVHGKRLAEGDRRVATCASCHGAHGVRSVRDAKSPVFPTNVAATCASCHADAQHMRGYKLADGSPLPTRQFADYQKSVHYAALAAGGDLSAPTCNDCHGNHGAAPPGVGSVARVCGTCHTVFAQRFEPSVHAAIFDKGCVECHSNHAVEKPSDAMLGVGAGAICATCHSGADDKGAAVATTMRSEIDRLNSELTRSTEGIRRVGNAGIEVSGEELKLADARTHLTLARTEMHSFDPGRVTPVIQSGLEIVADVDRARQQADRELAFRRRGLAVALGAILLVVVALWLKIRQIERV
jgi:predicted CXXCH cytochrome family protein